MITKPDFLRRLPKAELHCHLVGALSAPTLAELAGKRGIPLPRPPERLYSYANFYDFIDILRLAARTLTVPGDFERVVCEYVADNRRNANLRHLEMFFNPTYHYAHGVSYRAQLDGLLAGVRAAKRDHGVSVLLIPSFDREFGAAGAAQVLDDVLANRADEVVGIGLDGPEDKGPPQLFAEAYARARRAGLKRTAHVCEDYAPIPAENYAVCRDVLGCERLDHGYRLLTDPAMTERARKEGVTFTCCPKPSTRERDATRLRAIGRMSELGMRVTLATDDPRMFETDLNDSYERCRDGLGWDADKAIAVTLAGVDACWLDPTAKAALRRHFEAEIAALRAA